MATKQTWLKYQCLPMKQGTVTLYCFVADAKALWGVVRINARDTDKDEGYQRILSPSRVRAVSRYIDGGHAIPTSVLVSLEKAKYDEGTGEIHIRQVPDAGWVIDGQHRLAGAHEAKKLIELPVVAFIGLDVEAQIEQFVTINREAKGVPTSLYYDLLKNLPHKSASDMAKERAADLANELKKDEESPFHGRIVVTTAPSKGEISLTNFVRKVYPLLLEGRALSVYKGPEQAKIIHNYFAGLKVAFPQHFVKSSIFFQTLGFGALVNALPTALNLCVKNYQAFKVSDVAKLFQQIKHFDFSAWQNMGTGTAAETQAGDDLKQELLDAFADGGGGQGQTIDLGL
jgi:DGQHR domain-containing protein